MRLLRFLACFSLGSVLLLPSAFAQSSQDSQVPATSATPQAQQQAQPPTGDFLRNPFTQQNVGQPFATPKAGEAPRFKIKVLPQKRFRHQQLPDPRPRSSDPGIYLTGGPGPGNICGSIVSYNFSQGENPRLESVTTCTPAGTVQSRRAGDEEEKKPPEPRLIRTKD